VKNFICEVCEVSASENLRSEQWEEMCIYCNEMCLITNLELIRNQIKNYESQSA
jgi:hypothetical protein